MKKDKRTLDTERWLKVQNCLECLPNTIKMEIIEESINQLIFKCENGHLIKVTSNNVQLEMTINE